MIKIEDLKKAMENIDYKLSKRGEHYIMQDHKGKKFAWVWFGNRIEIEITDVVKVYYELKDTVMKILDGGIISIGTDDSGFFQMYNHDKEWVAEKGEK